MAQLDHIQKNGTGPDEALSRHGVAFWLSLARWLVIAFVVFQLGAVLLGTARFPTYVRENLDSFPPNYIWAAGETQAALRELGLPAGSVGWFKLGRDWIGLIVSYSLALILLRQKSLDGFRLLLAFVFILSRGTVTALQPTIQAAPFLNYFYNTIVSAVSWQFFFIILFLFPNGRPVPGWTRWIILTWLGYMVITLAYPNVVNDPAARDIVLGMAYVFVLSAVGSQVYRQLKYADYVQKQQTKWVVYSLLLMTAVLLPATHFAFAPPSQGSLGRDLVAALFYQTLFGLSFVLIELSILIAIVRYRLYDIDIIIRRTLVYSIVTALLGLIYLGGVTLLQTLFTAASGQASTASIVLSTLAIAALFNPLRRRVQDFIDRRFYRQKYNAEQALAQFASQSRQLSELDQLNENLLAVVRETMQPDNVSLWIAKEGNLSRDSLERAS